MGLGGAKKPPQFNPTIWCLATMKLGSNRVRPRTFQNNKKLVTLKTLSKNNVISNFSPIVPSEIRFFTTFFTFRQNKRKFYTGIQNFMLILIFGSKSSFGNDLGQSDAKKKLFYITFWPNAS